MQNVDSMLRQAQQGDGVPGADIAAGGAAGTGQNNKKIAAEKRLVTFQRGIGYISEIKTKNLPIYE